MNNWQNIYKVAIGKGTRTILPNGTILVLPYHGEVIFRDPGLMSDLLAAYKDYKNKSELEEAIHNGDFNIDKFLTDKGMILYGEEGNNTYYVRFSKPTRAALKSLVTLLPRMGRSGRIHISIVGEDGHRDDILSVDEFIEDYL